MNTNYIRKPYLAHAELTTFIIASVCNSIILQANVFIDAVIVGNYVSTDAMAVINLFAPLLILVTMVPMLLAEGSMVAGSHAFGEQDYPQVNRTFMVNLAGGLIFSLAAALPISLFAPSLVGLYTDNARLYPLALDYLPAAAFIGVAFAIQNSYTVFLQLTGKASLVVRVTIVQMMINLLFDLLFVVVFGWGIQGAVYATIDGRSRGASPVARVRPDVSAPLLVPLAHLALRQARSFRRYWLFRLSGYLLWCQCSSPAPLRGRRSRRGQRVHADAVCLLTGYDGCHLLHAVA